MCRYMWEATVVWTMKIESIVVLPIEKVYYKCVFYELFKCFWCCQILFINSMLYFVVQ